MKYSMDQIKLAMADSGHFTQQETLWAAKQFKEVLGRMVKSGEKFSTDQIRQALSKLNKRPSKIDDVISQLKKNESIQESIESEKDTEEIINSLTEGVDVQGMINNIEQFYNRNDKSSRSAREIAYQAVNKGLRYWSGANYDATWAEDWRSCAKFLMDHEDYFNPPKNLDQNKVKKLLTNYDSYKEGML